MTVREYLASKGYHEPMRIERTDPKPGDVVLTSWARPAIGSKFSKGAGGSNVPGRG